MCHRICRTSRYITHDYSRRKLQTSFSIPLLVIIIYYYDISLDDCNYKALLQSYLSMDSSVDYLAGRKSGIYYLYKTQSICFYWYKIYCSYYDAVAMARVIKQDFCDHSSTTTAPRYMLSSCYRHLLFSLNLLQTFLRLLYAKILLHNFD